MNVGFEVGKWYKVAGHTNTYKKCSNSILKNNFMPYNEEITYGKYNKTSGNCSSYNNRLTLVTDLSEIMLFLPIEHTDLQINKIIECW